MYQSKLFTKTKKEAPKDEESINARLLIRAGFIDKVMAGVYSYLPLGWKVLEKIQNIIREEMNSIGGQEIFMPSLQPKENWKETGRWNTMSDLYKIKDSSGRELALGPTHEEIISPLVKKFVSSYKDLPLYIYQFQNKFRMELRARSGIIRTREFMMKDLYSFHLDKEDLDRYYEKVTEAYKRIFDKLGIGDKTYFTFASGGSFAKYSHEFQTESEAGEDTIYICEKCKLAINKEIKDEAKICPECGNRKFKEAKAIEVGNIFKLMDRYSKPFDLSVVDKDGKKKEILMGCYGIGPGRSIGAIVELYHDKKGIIWPESIAPFKVHLISLGKNKDAEKIYQELIAKNVEVLFDDREISAGEKFADADLIGIPYRVVVSEKSLKAGGVEIKKRSGEKSEIVDIKKLFQYFITTNN